MLFDFRELDEGVTITGDVCVIGAGAAGISIAREFIGSNTKVLLLESGGLKFEGKVQLLSDGENVGLDYPALMTTRLRYFGGTTNHWGGWCRPFDELDFESRPWVPHSGWPISKLDIDPYYEAAQSVCELGPYRYRMAEWFPNGQRFPAFDREKLQTQLWQLSPPTRFGEVYRRELEEAHNIDVVLYANVSRLKADEQASSVRSAEVISVDGKRGSVRARFFVVACGGIENARLLLLSNDVERSGLGNRNDLVGRFFMEHPHAYTAVVLAKDPLSLATQFHSFREENPEPGPDTRWRMLPLITPTEKAQRRERILNYGAALWSERDFETGYDALGEIKASLVEGIWPDELGEKLWSVLTDLDVVARGIYRRAWSEPIVRPIKLITLRAMCESAPNPDSRVTLSDSLDPLGLCKTRLDWRLTELEQRTMRVVNQLIAEELGRLDLGRARIESWLTTDDGGFSTSVSGGLHHMGTTRMADTPAQGVVDTDCRVHGIENLYMAGSSVFPTSSCANPTLTLVALALRLAEHLRNRLSSSNA